MTSANVTDNLPPNGDSDSPDDEDKTVGGKATREERYIIDRACLELDIKRGPFIVQAAVEKARTVLAAKHALEQQPAS